ncbi:sensor histidine kinase [Bacteroidota bacterium]
MKDNMFQLIPNWAYSYNEFWDTVRKRNLRFIIIRYLAGIGLFSFLIIGQNYLQLKFSSSQIYSITVIAFSILCYNIIIHIIHSKISCISPRNFHCMHLSIIQMILDLTALMLLVYFTGTIHSPLYVFFIFHMVIGSLILPRPLIFLICFVVIIGYSILIYLQQINLVYSHIIIGLHSSEPLNTASSVIIFLLVFIFMMIFTVIIASRIALNLLSREGQLKETLDQLNKAEIAKQKYIMGVVHEIKTPISAAQTLIDLILYKLVGPLDSKVEEKLHRIKYRSEEALYLINNILKISNLRILHSTKSESLDIAKMIKEYLENKLDSFEAKNIQLHKEDIRTIKKLIIGEKDLVNLVISNLLSNTLKYVENDGNVEIVIRGDNENFILEICDDGIGIPEKDIKKIFEQFYRATNIKSLKVEGSGLGLSLVKEIITLHHGTISVKSPSRLSKKNRPGTCFIISLPYRRD